MKAAFTIIILSLAVNTYAKKIESKRLSTEKACEKEMRNLDCSNPEDAKAYLSCVDSRSEQLTPACQKFYREEMEKALANGDL